MSLPEERFLVETFVSIQPGSPPNKQNNFKKPAMVQIIASGRRGGWVAIRLDTKSYNCHPLSHEDLTKLLTSYGIIRGMSFKGKIDKCHHQIEGVHLANVHPSLAEDLALDLMMLAMRSTKPCKCHQSHECLIGYTGALIEHITVNPTRGVSAC